MMLFVVCALFQNMKRRSRISDWKIT